MTLKQNTLKNILILFLLFISNLLYSQLFFPTPIGAYKKYEKGEFDKAEADFKKILKKDAASVICIHGLAKIYADKSFKSFNLDTAYLYSDKSQSFINGSNDLEWSPNLTKKELNDIEKLELTPQNLRDFKDSILKRLFDDALSKNSITSYKNFIDKYPKAPQVSNAWINIHILAFNKASKDNTIDSYQNFITNYPEAKQINEAKIRIYDIAYSKASEINSIEGYQNFINSYPNASLVYEAKTKIHSLAYSEASGLNTVEAFQNFIKSYPDANQIKEAKNNIYSLAYANSVKINTMEAYKQFMTDYPDAPQSIQSLKNIHKIAFEDAKQQNTMIAYFQYNQLYPNSEYKSLVDSCIHTLPESELNFVTESNSGINNIVQSTNYEENTTQFNKNQDEYNDPTDKTVQIIVNGNGKTKDEAKQSALRSAIEQTYGAFVSSNMEIFNDQLVADQMSTVSSGNIKSYDILNESQLPDGSWGITLKAVVSVSKLTSFVEAKGVKIEIKGGMFALNIKQQLLNEQGEIQAIANMVGMLHEPMQMAFDYSIKSSTPKSIDDESKYWVIPLTVTATANKNMDICANYFKKTLAALSLSSTEVETYKSLNKQVFPVKVTYNDQSVDYYLRKESSIETIRSLTSNWESYTRLFAVQSGMDESYGDGEGQILRFADIYNRHSYYNIEISTINFPTSGQTAGTFSWNDGKTLSQIEQMTGYSVKPRGIISKFKNGGYVVYEKDGHGMVMSIRDIGKLKWNDAKAACDELILNGYNDWHLPSKEECVLIVKNPSIFKLGIQRDYYWSSTVSYNYDAWAFSLERYDLERKQKDYSQFVRAVRTY